MYTLCFDEENIYLVQSHHKTFKSSFKPITIILKDDLKDDLTVLELMLHYSPEHLMWMESF